MLLNAPRRSSFPMRFRFHRHGKRFHVSECAVDMLYFCFKDSIVIQIMSVPLVCHIVIIADNMLTRYMYEEAML